MRGIKSDGCDFCGTRGLVRSVGTSENPLMVTGNRMGTFYPSGRGRVNMCWNCTFASVYTYDGMFFRRYWKGRENFIDVFCVEGIDLQDLWRTLRLLSRLRIKERLGSYRIPREFRNARYPLENFLGFIIRMHKELKKRELTNVHGKRFHVFQAELVNRVLSINRYYVVPDVSRFLSLLDIVGRNYFRYMVEDFYIRRNGETDTLCREELSRRTLRGMEISDVIEDFLYKTLERKLGERFYKSCEHVTFTYEKKIMKMKVELLENCKRLGETLGRLSADKDDKGIFYDLRSVRNLDGLLANFYSILTKYAEEIKVNEMGVNKKGFDKILQEIDDKNWKRYKSIIGIWTVLSYVMHKGRKRSE